MMERSFLSVLRRWLLAAFMVAVAPAGHASGLDSLDVFVKTARSGRAALAECALAKSVRLGRPVLAVVYCCGQIVRGSVRRGLEKLGLYGLVRAFRKRFSIVPKT